MAWPRRAAGWYRQIGETFVLDFRGLAVVIDLKIKPERGSENNICCECCKGCQNLLLDHVRGQDMMGMNRRKYRDLGPDKRKGTGRYGAPA